MQFSAEDVGIADAVDRATIVELGGGIRLRVATVGDLIVLKMAAAEEPKRRPSKREHNVADVLALLEDHRELRTPETLARLREVRMKIMTSGFADSASEE